jgi:hypothetical protein
MTVNVESEDEQNVDTLTVPHVAVDVGFSTTHCLCHYDKLNDCLSGEPHSEEFWEEERG